MNRKRKWLVDLLQRTGNPYRRPRRIVSPERLESRNAPGVMLPLFGSTFDGAGNLAGESDTTSARERSEGRVFRYSYYSEAVAPRPEMSMAIAPFVEELRSSELTSAVPLNTGESQIRVPYEIAALDAAFASYSAGLNRGLSELSQRLIQPVIMDPASPHNQEEPAPIPVAEVNSPHSSAGTGSGAVSTPTPTGNVRTDVSAPLPAPKQVVVPIVLPTPTEETLPEPVTPVTTPTEAVPVDLGPRIIQPVIMDPESEHNVPSPEPPVQEVQIEPLVLGVTAAAPEAIEIETLEALTPVLSVVESVIPQVSPLVSVAPVVTPGSTVSTLSTPDQLSASEVELLLDRASRVTDRTDAIIAIVDRGGRILGVHVEQTVLDTITEDATLVFAIDGAIAKARTAAFFSNNEAALTSRTVRFISQSTITQREAEANPNSLDEEIRGPGFVAPIGLGGHFPPDVAFTPHVDLFAIEHTNRDSRVFPGTNGIRDPVVVDDDGNPIAVTGDDILLSARFGADFDLGKDIPAPESFGLVSNRLTNAQSRGIATLPGGVPLYKVDPADGKSKLVGGIGVFFPGPAGYATFEQGFIAGAGQTTNERLNAPLVLEAEYTAAVIAVNKTMVDGLPPVPGIGDAPIGRIDLVGITLESFGPHPFKLDSFLAFGQSKYTPGTDSGSNLPVTKGGAITLAGEQVPSGWLVSPKASAELTAQEVEDIIMRGVEEAKLVRSAIRLPLGQRSQMALAVTDLDGEILGLFRMEDSTFFSIDVAVAKARNVAYYDDPTEVKDIDRIDVDGDGTPEVAAGVSFTNRTFRFVAEPRYPSGIDGTTPPPFSTLLTVGINPSTGENLPGVIPDVSDFTTVLGFDAFHPMSNFRQDVSSLGYQNGVVFFPGSTALYNNSVLVGGFGVSGDGVDQDDVVTFVGAGEFLPRSGSGVTRADQVFVNGVRLPFQKFLRNPHG